MGKTFFRLFYHVVWTTYLREPTITPEIEKLLYNFLENKAKRFHCYLHAIGGIEDHLHLAITIPPAECVSDIVGKLKGSSSYFLNKELHITTDFGWQSGFGILSFSQKDLVKIIHYISTQKEHHRTGKLNAKMEIIEDEDA